MKHRKPSSRYVTLRQSTAAPRCRRQNQAAVLAAFGIALVTAGCQSPNILESIGSRNVTGATSTIASAGTPARSQAEWRREAETLSERYRADPHDAQMALAYARALRASGQRTQAASVLEQASLADPNDT